MQQAQTTLRVSTNGQGFTNISRELEKFVAGAAMQTGLLTVFICHTSASLTIQENADPDVMDDLGSFFERISPQDPSLYRHTLEGRDDMPAHIRSSLTDASLSIPVANGRLVLGTWQGVYVCEHRARGHNRSVVLHLVGE